MRLKRIRADSLPRKRRRRTDFSRLAVELEQLQKYRGGLRQKQSGAKEKASGGEVPLSRAHRLRQLALSGRAHQGEGEVHRPIDAPPSPVVDLLGRRLQPACVRVHKQCRQGAKRCQRANASAWSMASPTGALSKTPPSTK